MENEFICNLCRKKFDVKERATAMPSFGELCDKCFDIHILKYYGYEKIKNYFRIIPEIENEIVIEDFRIIKKAKIKFSPGLNLIIGKNKTGKTTVVDYLVKLFDLNTMSLGNKIMFEIDKEINKGCILMDDILGRLDNENLIKTLKDLETCNRQVIAILNISRLNEIQGKVKVNIIKTEDFELEKEVR